MTKVRLRVRVDYPACETLMCLPSDCTLAEFKSKLSCEFVALDPKLIHSYDYRSVGYLRPPVELPSIGDNGDNSISLVACGVQDRDTIIISAQHDMIPAEELELYYLFRDLAPDRNNDKTSTFCQMLQQMVLKRLHKNQNAGDRVPAGLPKSTHRSSNKYDTIFQLIDVYNMYKRMATQHMDNDCQNPEHNMMMPLKSVYENIIEDSSEKLRSDFRTLLVKFMHSIQRDCKKDKKKMKKQTKGKNQPLKDIFTEMQEINCQTKGEVEVSDVGHKMLDAGHRHTKTESTSSGLHSKRVIGTRNKERADEERGAKKRASEELKSSLKRQDSDDRKDRGSDLDSSDLDLDGEENSPEERQKVAFPNAHTSITDPKAAFAAKLRSSIHLLDACSFICSCLRHRQAFFRLYIEAMKQRLISNKSCMETEAQAANRLESHFQSKTAAFTRMLRERRRSDDMMIQFSASHVHSHLNGWTMRLCGRGWFQRLIKFNVAPLKQLLPASYQLLLRSYQLFLSKEYSKKLEWVPSEGHALVEIRFPKSNRPWSFGLSTYQMMILLLFNKFSTLSVKDILRLTNIPRAELPPHLLALSHPRVHILLKKPPSRRLADNHRFKLVPKFRSHWQTVKVPLLKATASVCGDEWDRKEKASLQRVNTQVTEVMVVRVLAKYGSAGVRQQDLITEVLERTLTVYVDVTTEMIAAGIEALIRRGWIRLEPLLSPVPSLNPVASRTTDSTIDSSPNVTAVSVNITTESTSLLTSQSSSILEAVVEQVEQNKHRDLACVSLFTHTCIHTFSERSFPMAL